MMIRVRWLAVLLGMGLLLGQSWGDGAVPAGGDAAKALAAQLGGLKDTQTLEAHFICEKKLALLDTPLLSRGELWIRRGDARTGEGAVRFSTEKPYVSDLILVKGKVFVRSQHETEWTKTDQSGRPGLTAVMAQLGGWSTGEAGKAAQDYAVATSAAAMPEMPAGPAAATQAAKGESEVFVLTPTNKDLAKAVKTVTVAIDRTSHHLLFIEILTAQDDATRYWFYDVKDNLSLPADVFVPTAAPAAATAPASDKP
jgi:outer membrane lipoprotein-sorting protein